MAQLTDQYAPQQYPRPFVNTTGATVTELLRIDVPSNGILVLEYTLTAQRTDGTFGRAAFTRRVVCANNAGTAAVNIENAIGTDYNPNSYTGPTHAVAGSGAAGLIVSVAGASSTPLKWTITYRAII